MTEQKNEKWGRMTKNTDTQSSAELNNSYLVNQSDY